MTFLEEIELLKQKAEAAKEESERLRILLHKKATAFSADPASTEALDETADKFGAARARERIALDSLTDALKTLEALKKRG